MNIESILRKTISYEDWIIKRLQDDQEVETYLQSCLDVFREDGDLDGLLSAIELVCRAKSKGGFGPLFPVVELDPPHMSQINLPDFDNLPLDQLPIRPMSVSERTPNHPSQPDLTDYHRDPSYIHNPSDSNRMDEDNTSIDPSGIQYLCDESLWGFNTLGFSLSEQDRALEYR